MRTHILVATLAVAGSVVTFPLAAGQHQSPSQLPPLTLRQIETVTTATASLVTTEKAREAGYSSALGWVPMMGTHWVHGPRMLKGKDAVTLTEPSQLMFSKVNGRETLVGAAYAYYGEPDDKAQPVLFESAPAWHDHPDLSPPGTNMYMLHVWFVESPDGPFAGLNPFLPYWAAGVTPPDVARMHDAAFGSRVRKGALALAEIVDPAGLFPVLARRAGPRAVLDERRPTIQGLVAALNAAHAAKDWTAWDARLDELGAHFDAIRDAYVASALDPAVKERIGKAIDDMIRGGHKH
jgi:hypothetical protein